MAAGTGGTGYAGPSKRAKNPRHPVGETETERNRAEKGAAAVRGGATLVRVRMSAGNSPEQANAPRRR